MSIERRGETRTSWGLDSVGNDGKKGTGRSVAVVLPAAGGTPEPNDEDAQHPHDRQPGSDSKEHGANTGVGINICVILRATSQGIAPSPTATKDGAKRSTMGPAGGRSRSVRQTISLRGRDVSSAASTASTARFSNMTGLICQPPQQHPRMRASETRTGGRQTDYRQRPDIRIEQAGSGSRLTQLLPRIRRVHI